MNINNRETIITCIKSKIKTSLLCSSIETKSVFIILENKMWVIPQNAEEYILFLKTNEYNNQYESTRKKQHQWK